MKEASYYQRLDEKAVRCFLCAHACTIKDKNFGFCSVRENCAGALYTHAYGNVVAANVDPVEKKPFYHFYPGSKSFSIALKGCNFRCGFCQNWEISQLNSGESSALEEDEFSAKELVDAAVNNDCQSIAYTYTEPTIFFEYAYDIAKLAKERSLQNIFVTNGYIAQDPLKAISPYLDGANIDLKFFKDSSYRKFCEASLAPVLDCIRLMKELGIWVEITTLLIPGINDNEEEISSIADFIASVDKNMPWHLSRFHPDYKFNEFPPTSEAILRKAINIGNEKGLNFVYAGNITGWGNDTFCPCCKKLIIKRDSLRVLEYNLKDSGCSFCGTRLPGIFLKEAN
ncbi:MAG: AmmeMemoRadiSam system radical SAM enzyme [Candidatus Omnitrophica bacterium]|nr:AmmeMemoRadiSam system radical SAM enzyme [Candidatus Omnitrophota bacterium]